MEIHFYTVIYYQIWMIDVLNESRAIKLSFRDVSFILCEGGIVGFWIECGFISTKAKHLDKKIVDTFHEIH